MIESETYLLRREFYDLERRKKNHFTPLKSIMTEQKYEICGFDLETYASNGNLLTLCLSDGNSLTLPNQKPDFEDLYYFLKPYLQSHKGRYYFFGWNSAFDIMIMLKGLGKSLREMYENEWETTYRDWNLKYIYKKCLFISDKTTGRNLKFFDIMKFFGGGSLDKVSKKFLGEQKRYSGQYQDKKFPDMVYFNRAELDLIKEYCLLDSRLTQRLAQYWISNFTKSFNFYPRNYVSAGSLALEYIRTRLQGFPNYVTFDDKISELAYKCFFGGRFEIFKRGHYSNIHHYDINSAYPAAMVAMPDFFNGKWVAVDKVDYSIMDRVGFYEIEGDVWDNYIPPFMFRAWKNVYAPIGSFKVYVTAAELNQATNHYHLNLRKMKGYYFEPGNNQDTTFNKMIEDMYRARLEQTDEGIKYVYKVIINSIYGKTAQRLPHYGKGFSPVLCSYITGWCRAKLLEIIGKSNPQSVIAVATDGLFATQKLKAEVSTTKELGKLDYNFEKEIWVAMSGIYTYQKKNGEFEYKTRGFSTHIKDSATGKKKPFDLSKMGRVDREFLIYQDRAHTLAQSIRSNLEDNIGFFETTSKILNFNKEKKRKWSQKLVTMECQQDSEPWDVNDLSN